MKKIIILLLMAFGIRCYSQDTLNITNVSLSARLIEYSAQALLVNQSEENLSTFFKWRKSYKTASVSNNGSVITDTIPVATIVYLYGYILNNPEGYSISASFKSAIVPYRTANTNLDRQCTALEDMYTSNFIGLRRIGKKILSGQ